MPRTCTLPFPPPLVSSRRGTFYPPCVRTRCHARAILERGLTDDRAMARRSQSDGRPMTERWQSDSRSMPDAGRARACGGSLESHLPGAPGKPRSPEEFKATGLGSPEGCRSGNRRRAPTAEIRTRRGTSTWRSATCIPRRSTARFVRVSRRDFRASRTHRRGSGGRIILAPPRRRRSSSSSRALPKPRSTVDGLRPLSFLSFPADRRAPLDRCSVLTSPPDRLCILPRRGPGAVPSPRGDARNGANGGVHQVARVRVQSGDPE